MKLTTVLFLSALSASSASAGQLSIRCQPFAIDDPTGAKPSKAQVELRWKDKEAGYQLTREDKRNSALGKLEVTVLKRLEFETRKFRTEGANIVETIATYKVRVTSDRCLIGTETHDGDMMIRSKSQVAVVVCEEHDVTPW